MAGFYGASSMFQPGQDAIGPGIGQAITPGIMQNQQPIGQIAGAFGNPQAKQPSFWDKYNEFMGGAGQNIGQSLDALSQLGMTGQQLNAAHPVPNASPFIGPGIYGLQNLAQSFSGRG